MLFVCTGNICRSPFAELLARHLLAGRFDRQGRPAFEVSSAGVQAVVGEQMHPWTRDELMPWNLDGVEAGRFAARQLDTAMIRSADLVLGASPRHGSAVVQRAPEAVGNVFSLLGFARLTELVDPAVLPDEPVARARVLVEQVRAHRRRAPQVTDDDHLPDPMGRPPEAHHAAGTLTAAALQTIVGRIVPAGRPRVGPGGSLR